MAINGFLLFLILLNAYLLLVFLAARSGLLARYNIGIMGPALMFRTNRGKGTIEWISKPKRFHRASGTVGIWVTLTFMGLLMALLFFQLPFIFRIPVEQAPQARHILALPGINPLIPIGYGIVALIVAIVIHEFAHGVLARAQDMGVKSLGVLYLIVPIGAFVEPDEEELKQRTRKERMRVYAAGPMSNLVTALLLGIIFSVGFIGAAEPIDDGLGVRIVMPESPAGEAGLQPGMLITTVNDTHVGDGATFRATLNQTRPGGSVEIETAKHGSFSFCLASREDAARLAELGPGVDWCTRYPENGTRIAATRTTEGDPLDTRLAVQPAWARARENITFRLDATHAENATFTWTLDLGDRTDPISGDGDTLPATYVHTYRFEGLYTATFTVATENHTRVESLDVNVGGLMGIEMYPFSPGEIQDRLANPFQDLPSLALYVALPFTGITPMTSPLTDMYEIPFGDGAFAKKTYWVSANVVYWIMWISLMLGLTNALPAVPLDGGWLFRDFIDGIAQRVRPNGSAEGRAKFVKRVSIAVSILVLLLIVVQFIGPRIAPFFLN